MKVFISADIEGVSGITAPDEANPDHREIRYFQEQMTAEVAAACEGAIKAGATEILVKDAHWTGRNIDHRKLPECVKMVRGWTGHPFSMMAELDKTFAAALYVGYHARAGSAGNPLAHTMSGSIVGAMRINDRPASEFLINTYTATMVGVPVVFLSGDRALCDEVREYNPTIVLAATLVGIGTGTVSDHPNVALHRIREGVEVALKGDFRKNMHRLPERFKIEIDYKQPKLAYGRSFYPGAELVGEATVRYESRDYFDILRMMHFCIK